MNAAPARDAARRRELVTMKRRATGLLVLMTGVWAALATGTDGGGWLGYAQAAAEASMVGAVADWFAVTALFRHPLGLPIPHTAIVVERKDQFGRTLGEFVQSNFLSPEVIGARVRTGRYVERGARWLDDPVNASTVASHASSAAVAVADAIRDEDVNPVIAVELERAVRALPLARIAGSALETMTAKGRHRPLLNSLLVSLEQFLAENKDALRLRFSNESPWWLPGAVENRIFERLLDGVSNLVHDAASDGDHELRLRIDEWLMELAVRLQTSSELAERVDAFKVELLSHEELGRWTSSTWAELRTRLRGQASEPDSELRLRLAGAIAAAGRRVLADPVLLARLERFAESAASQLADRFRDELADLISGTISRWDATDTSQRLELLLGRDLQFIRINGTIVGGAVGLAIHTIAEQIR